MQEPKLQTSVNSNPWLYAYALILSFCTFILIAAGGLVTSHEAGLAVPDWPLSYGQLFPPMVGNIFWEHGHRMIAGTVGILTLLFTVLVYAIEKRHWMKRLARISLGAVIIQALLGGLTVLYLLPAPISIFHACLGQSFFTLTVLMAYFLSPGFSGAREASSRLFTGTASVVFLQLILGATVRHTDHGVTPHVLAHIAGALAVVFFVFASLISIVRNHPNDSFLFRASVALGVCVIFQIFLGFAAFILKHLLERSYAPSVTEVFFTASHQTNGAVLLALAVLIAVRKALR
jgi:heme a synthase